MRQEQADIKKEIAEILGAIGYKVKSVRDEEEGTVIKVVQEALDQGKDNQSNRMIN